MIGAQIKAYRKAKDLSGKELGEKMGLSGTTIYRLENNDPNVTYKVRMRVKNYLKQNGAPEIPESDSRKPIDPMATVITGVPEVREPELYTIPEKNYIGRMDGFYIFKK